MGKHTREQIIEILNHEPNKNCRQIAREICSSVKKVKHIMRKLNEEE